MRWGKAIAHMAILLNCYKFLGKPVVFWHKASAVTSLCRAMFFGVKQIEQNTCKIMCSTWTPNAIFTSCVCSKNDMILNIASITLPGSCQHFYWAASSPALKLSIEVLFCMKISLILHSRELVTSFIHDKCNGSIICNGASADYPAKKMVSPCVIAVVKYSVHAICHWREVRNGSSLLGCLKGFYRATEQAPTFFFTPPEQAR